MTAPPSFLEYLVDRNVTLKRQFALIRRRQLGMALPLLLLVLLLIVLGGRHANVIPGLQGHNLSYALAVLVAGGWTFTLWNWRCPACHRFLGLHARRSCRHCGARLR